MGPRAGAERSGAPRPSSATRRCGDSRTRADAVSETSGARETQGLLEPVPVMGESCTSTAMKRAERLATPHEIPLLGVARNLESDTMAARRRGEHSAALTQERKQAVHVRR